jgi:ferredoxin
MATEGSNVRITVDQGRCEGHGLCEQAAEEIFQLDDDGILKHRYAGKDIPEALESRASDAVFACPVAALSIEQPAAPGAAPSSSNGKRL